MNPLTFALRRPWTVMVAILAIVLACSVALRPKWVDQSLAKIGVDLPLQTMKVDIFPALNLPVIYVCQPYGGMDAAQMEGLLTNYYEYHFLYISNIHHVESRNIQGTALMKLIFHPGTDMSQAMAETINYVNRSRAMMPPGTVSPFVMRFDTGSVPVGYLVLSSDTRTVGEIQDQALFKVRPLFSALPGVSAPPPFGGSARTVVIRANPDRLRSYNISPDEVVTALALGNSVSPSGNMHVGTSYPIVPTNALVKDIKELGSIPIRTQDGPPVYVRDVATIDDATDLPTGYALVNGRRAVYILATKRAEASTMSVIDEIKKAIPAMQAELPPDIKVSFEFDQSPYVTRAVGSLLTEGLLGALLTGLMVLVFLRDWRSALVVVLNIPLAIMAAVLGLWLCGQTINLMTLGGLALAVGILVDEATVEIENIHTQFQKTDSMAMAVRLGNSETAVPRLLAMLCILAVFVPSFFMQGAARNLFIPLSLAVGFSMIASYILSSTFVPILSIWLLKRTGSHAHANDSAPLKSSPYRRLLGQTVAWRWVVVPVYLAASVLIVVFAGRQLGLEIFPQTGVAEFRLKFRAPDGTHFDTTEDYAIKVLDEIGETVGRKNVDLTLGYVGTIPSSFPINGVYQWSRGPEEGLLRIALKHGTGIDVEETKNRLRQVLGQKYPELRFSFEPADIISEVMSFGSPTPVEIAVRGANLQESEVYARELEKRLRQLPSLRDVQIAQSLAYPTINVSVDREKASMSGTNASQIARSVVAATSSTRFVAQNYWPDPKTGIGYQVQIEIPQPTMTQAEDLAMLPVDYENGQSVLLRDVARLTPGTQPGQFDRYNMKRELTITANISGVDLGTVSREVQQVLSQMEKEGLKPKSITTEIRGQVPTLRQILSGLGVGLVLAILVIFLLLTANFQSIRLALATVSTVPAVLAGVVVALWLTGSTLNIESFIGAIMAIGVAMANAILLVTFAEQSRKSSHDSREAAIEGGSRRLRAILMTSLAMTAGMIPMAAGLGEEGAQTAPLGRAVIGGLLAATFATLLVLPAVYALVLKRASSTSASLDPLDSESRYFVATS
ncbi:efflux RND transporter permease subunit [Planctopirus hydrillae]|uniref:Acriflavin resistance protein n=1 Tax=Planctopirus hydrillae TaxID=1841610 RepID=A0A1C3ESP8_9PLAN|nr:efflux RND transporter permease subunit [Planctopirus hydrillae]ODA36357.1 acriflavin resistance protein [Planctopirus hydrillae]